MLCDFEQSAHDQVTCRICNRTLTTAYAAEPDRVRAKCREARVSGLLASPDAVRVRRPTATDLPCVHRGEEVDRLGCCGAVYRCAKKKLVVIGENNWGFKRCDECDEREPPVAKTYPADSYLVYSDLVADTLSLVPQIPPDVAVIVGVARSGMLPATILAMHLHKPLYTLTDDGIFDVGHGYRLRNPATKGRALIVDDTLMSGWSLKKAREVADKHWPDRLHAHVYTNPAADVRPDLSAAYLPDPHLLEWNLFNSIHVQRSAFDFDGILCRDFTAEEDDDGDRYLAALEAMEPRVYPRKQRINVVTARLSKYRGPTLRWLRRHGIRCASLTMGPWKTKAERDRADVAAWKAERAKRLGVAMFIESDPRQAKRIAQLAGVLAICPPAKRCFRK